MGNANSSKKTGVQPSQPGSSSESGNVVEGHQQASVAQPKEQPKPVQSASEYQLSFDAEPEFRSYTYDQDVSKFWSQVVVEAPRFDSAESRPPVDIVAVLDVSGSMYGEKISLVRKSMRRLLRSMGDRDRVAFISFDTQVETVMDFCNMTEENKQRAFKLIKNLRDGSSTNLVGGVCSGVETLLKNRVNEVAAVLLFTDGEANVGVRSKEGIVKAVLDLTARQTPLDLSNVEGWSVEDVGRWLESKNLQMYKRSFSIQKIDGGILLHDLNEEILTNELNVSGIHRAKFMREITKLRENFAGEGMEGQQGSTKPSTPQGFRLHTFGFGSNHNNKLLESLAEKFDGMYYFMENEETIKAGFANCLGGLLSTTAQNIELNIQFNPEITEFKVHKDDVVANEIGKFKISFADLQSEEKRHVLVSCNLPKLKNPCENYMIYEVEYKYDNMLQKQTLSGTVQCEVNRNGKIDFFSESVDERRNYCILSDAMLEAQEHADRSQMAEAREVLNKAMTSIQNSRTGQSTSAEGLVSDLQTALHKFRDQRAYRNEGMYYASQNYQCVVQERACNFQADFVCQKGYNTEYRAAMVDQFDCSDEEDSVEWQPNYAPTTSSKTVRITLSSDEEELYTSDVDDALLPSLSDFVPDEMEEID